MAAHFESNPSLLMLRVYQKELGIPTEYWDGRHALLEYDFSYIDKNGKRHVAKSGMVTDGGSIPRFFWRAIEDPFGSCLPAYLIHDQMCEDANKLEGVQREKAEKEADELFMEMLETLNVAWIKRRLMYRGVRVGHTFDE